MNSKFSILPIISDTVIVNSFKVPIPAKVDISFLSLSYLQEAISKIVFVNGESKHIIFPENIVVSVNYCPTLLFDKLAASVNESEKVKTSRCNFILRYPCDLHLRNPIMYDEFSKHLLRFTANDTNYVNNYILTHPAALRYYATPVKAENNTNLPTVPGAPKKRKFADLCKEYEERDFNKMLKVTTDVEELQLKIDAVEAMYLTTRFSLQLANKRIDELEQKLGLFKAKRTYAQNNTKPKRVLQRRDCEFIGDVSNNNNNNKYNAFLDTNMHTGETTTEAEDSGNTTESVEY